MECPTYKLLLVNSKSAISESEMEEIKTILADISDEDLLYYHCIHTL